MNKRATASEGRYMARVAGLRCLICKRFPDLATGLPVEVHHVAEGTSPQNNFGVAPLCGSRTDGGHHRGGAGLHVMQRRFFLVYKVPHLCEYGLLIWTAQDLQEQLEDHQRFALGVAA